MPQDSAKWPTWSRAQKALRKERRWRSCWRPRSSLPHWGSAAAFWEYVAQIPGAHQDKVIVVVDKDTSAAWLASKRVYLLRSLHLILQDCGGRVSSMTLAEGGRLLAEIHQPLVASGALRPFSVDEWTEAPLPCTPHKVLAGWFPCLCEGAAQLPETPVFVGPYPGATASALRGEGAASGGAAARLLGQDRVAVQWAASLSDAAADLRSCLASGPDLRSLRSCVV